MLIVNKNNVFLYANNNNTSSVERHMLANQKVRVSILSQADLSFCCPVHEFTQVFTQKLQGKTRVQNTRGTREIKLTESRV